MFGLHPEHGRSAEAPLRVLALGAHPDDIEIGAGGSLLRLLDERRHIHVEWVVLSGTEQRRREAEWSANAYLRDVSHCVTVQAFTDGRFPSEVSGIKSFFAETLQPLAPDLVLTHRLEDAHQDHRVLAELTWQTFRGATIVAYEIPKWEGDLRAPNGYVRLSQGIVKRKMDLLMEAFPSQASKLWFDAELFRGLMRLRGAEAATVYAEAFHCSKLVW